MNTYPLKESLDMHEHQGFLESAILPFCVKRAGHQHTNYIKLRPSAKIIRQPDGQLVDLIDLIDAIWDQFEKLKDR